MRPSAISPREVNSEVVTEWQARGNGSADLLFGIGCYVRHVEFGILGPLAVWRNGHELELGAAKQRARL
jgi:hypothetical protein